MTNKQEVEKIAKDLAKVSTVARNMGVSPKYVYDLIKKSKLDGVEFDGVKFILMNDLYRKTLETLKKD